MIAKYTILALAAASSITEVAALNRHRHMHAKKDIVYAHTEIDIVTEVVTVTVGDETSTSSVPTSTSSASVFREQKFESVSSSSSTTETPTPSPTPTTTSTSTPPPPPSTTLVSSVKASPEVAAAVATTTSAAPKATTTTTSSGSSSGNSGKRGLSYDDPAIAAMVASQSNVFSWMYDWQPTKKSGAPGLEFYPMAKDATSTWLGLFIQYIASMLSGGSNIILSFNEPDHTSQANLSPAAAAAAHIASVLPYKGSAKVASPAITSNVAPGTGVDWLASFLSILGSANAPDYCACHWYGPGGSAGADLMMAYTLQVSQTCGGKPIMLTEFAPIDCSEADKLAFYQAALPQLDAAGHVFKYAAFMMGPGWLLNSDNSFTEYGKLYAGLS